jgi:hypothetical protein
MLVVGVKDALAALSEVLGGVPSAGVVRRLWDGPLTAESPRARRCIKGRLGHEFELWKWYVTMVSEQGRVTGVTGETLNNSRLPKFRPKRS